MGIFGKRSFDPFNNNDPWLYGGGVNPNNPWQMSLGSEPSAYDYQGRKEVMDDMTQDLPAGAAPKKKGGFFKKFLRDFAGFEGDALTGTNSYHDDMVAQHEAMAHQQAAELARRAHLQDYEAEKQIDAKYAGPKQRRTLTVDGVVLDEDTMKPIWESPYPKVYQGPQGGFSEQPRMGIDALQGQGSHSGSSSAREEAAEAIRRGADPEAVARRLREIEGGASPSNGSGGFPGY